MYDVNGVQSFLESLPYYDYHIDNTANMQAKITSYNRPTIGMKLSCIAAGHTRDWAISTLLKTQAVVEIDNSFFFKMGMTLVIGFSCWIALALFAHLVALKKESTKKTTEMLIWVMYVPSRASFLCWGIWLAVKSGHDLNNVKDNIDNTDQFETFNGCVDSYSQVDIESLSNELDQAKNTLSFVYYTFWSLVGIFTLEVIFWFGFCCFNTMEKSSEHHLKDHEKKQADDTVHEKTLDSSKQQLLQQPQQPQTVVVVQGGNQQQQYPYGINQQMMQPQMQMAMPVQVQP